MSKGRQTNHAAPACFIKFGQEDHMKDFFLNGILYCNTFDEFIKLEDDLLKGDNDE